MRPGLTICFGCGHAVPVATSFCELCGQIFSQSVMSKQITARETHNTASLTPILYLAA